MSKELLQKAVSFIGNGIDDEQQRYIAASFAAGFHKSMMPRWIPVSERLPELNECEYFYSTELGVCKGNYSVQYDYFITDYSINRRHVTHWMPRILPLPPAPGKEESND